MNRLKLYNIYSYLTYRYVVKDNKDWMVNFTPKLPVIDIEQEDMKTTADIDLFLKDKFKTLYNDYKNPAILLSGGIDSAILASYMKPGTKAYTIVFDAEGAIDESIMAKYYAEEYQIDLTVIKVTWEDYLEHTETLIRNKQSLLHAIEPALYVAALKIKENNHDIVVVGNGADSTFGGMDKLLTKDFTNEDYTVNEFIDRYAFSDIQSILGLIDVKIYREVLEPFFKYSINNKMDVPNFLKNVHGIGIIQAFNNPFNITGIKLFEPFEEMTCETLDMERIKNNEPKYLLQALFKERYPTIEPPRKIPFARPMNIWLKDDSHLQDLKKDIRFNYYIDEKQSGETRWLLYCINTLLTLEND